VTTSISICYSQWRISNQKVF